MNVFCKSWGFFLLFFFCGSLIKAEEKKKICILYSSVEKIPKINWYDGFVKAIEVLEEKYDFDWFATPFHQVAEIPFPSYHAVLIKSNFHSSLVSSLRKCLPNNIPRALLISSSHPPRDPDFFDVLFYETNWYSQYIENHRCIIHAFGINTEIMKPPPRRIKKQYDYIMVADLHHRKKRVLKLLDKPGKKVLISGIRKLGPKEKKIKNRLIKGGVTVIDFVRFDQLPYYYYRARKAYNAATTLGGGDRFLLEARACGLKVEIERDNPKLRELLKGPIYDHRYYAKQLDRGIQVLLDLN